jgi:hypothetical protein
MSAYSSGRFSSFFDYVRVIRVTSPAPAEATTMPLSDLFRQHTQAAVASLTSHRIILYTLVSTVAVSVAIANALKNQSNFFSVAIHLSNSNRSVVVSTAGVDRWKST